MHAPLQIQMPRHKYMLMDGIGVHRCITGFHSDSRRCTKLKIVTYTYKCLYTEASLSYVKGYLKISN